MAWTQSELDALKRAYAAGTLRVTSDGRTIEYGDAADLLSRMRIIESEIAQITGSRLPVAGYATFRRGER
jgi:hypothetical protein